MLRALLTCAAGHVGHLQGHGEEHGYAATPRTRIFSMTEAAAGGSELPLGFGATYERAYRQQRSPSEVLAERATLLLRLDRSTPAGREAWRTSEAILRRILESSPSDAGVASNLGGLLLRSGREREAEAVFRRTLRDIDGAHVATMANLALLLGATPAGREEARRLHRHVLAMVPNHADNHVNMAIAAAADGDSAGARRLYGRALVADPSHLAALVNLAALGSAVEASELYSQVLALAPIGHRLYQIAKLNLARVREFMEAEGGAVS